MALLSPDDVREKMFTAMKRRGDWYDQGEVDDFLDEVVETLGHHLATTSELTAKLEAAERRIAELGAELDDAERGTPGADPTAPPAVVAPVAQAPAEAPAPVHEVPPPATDVPPSQDAPESAAGMLALAQRLHDEHVAHGREQAERALGEARAEADRLLTEARSEHSRLLGEATTESERMLTEARGERERLMTETEADHNRLLAGLEQEKSLLERKIEELQVFERDYRARMTEYLERLLADVDVRPERRDGGADR